jgi:hypothetical protein
VNSDGRDAGERISEATYRLALVRELRRQALAIDPVARIDWFTTHVAQAHLFPSSPFRDRVVLDLLTGVSERLGRSSMPVMATLVAAENKARFALEAARNGGSEGVNGYVPLPHERTTEPRWRCLITGNLEYCLREGRSRGPEAARRRLAKSCLCGNAKGHVYRAGFVPRGPIL